MKMRTNSKKIIGNMFLGTLCGCCLTFAGVSPAFAKEDAGRVKKAAVQAEKQVPKVEKVKPAPSEDVLNLQKALNKAGFKLKEDGLTGKRTKAALKKFQKQNGLKVTGKPDTPTLAKLGIK